MQVLSWLSNNIIFPVLRCSLQGGLSQANSFILSFNVSVQTIAMILGGFGNLGTVNKNRLGNPAKKKSLALT